MPGHGPGGVVGVGAVICAWDLCDREAEDGSDYCCTEHALLDEEALDLVSLSEQWDAEVEAAADAGLARRTA